MLELGGREFGEKHYPAIIVMHTTFFASLVVEFYFRGAPLAPFWEIPFILFALGQVLRFWTRRTMGDRWTTRILVIQGERLIARGPFRYIQHPIYLAVVFELFSLPLIFGLYATCVVFTVWNALMLLTIRIPAEARALFWSQKSS